MCLNLSNALECNMLSLHKKIVGIFGILFFTLMFSGCATFYAKPVPNGDHLVSWPVRQHQLAAFNNWKASGSFGVTVDGKTNIASFDWQQIGKKYVINIYTALHVGSAKIVGDSCSVTLWKSENERISAKTPEELLYKQFGWSLPVYDLIYWVKGMPAPIGHVKREYFDAFKHLIGLEQESWKIQYRDFVSVGDIDVPSKIYLENPKLKIKIVIKHWNM